MSDETLFAVMLGSREVMDIDELELWNKIVRMNFILILFVFFVFFLHHFKGFIRLFLFLSLWVSLGFKKNFKW